MSLLACVLLLAAAAPALAASADAGSAVQAATAWVMDQQEDNHGWKSETGKAVMALTLANASITPVEQELILKQLQIYFLVDMWGGVTRDTVTVAAVDGNLQVEEQRKAYPLTTGRIAEYVLAFAGLCFDVQDFHGRDLTAILRRHPGVMDYETAFVVLATCASGSAPKRRSYGKLIGITDESDDLHGTDTLALAVLALRCVEKTTMMDVTSHLETPLKALVRRQQSDGGFGNFHSSILAVQALRAASEPGWNETAAMSYLLSHQQKDGSFGNMFDTTQVLPVLAGKSLADVDRTACHHRQPDVPATTTVAPTTPSPATAAPPVLINFTFWLWVGKPPNATHHITLTIPQNTSLFDAMKLAAERDSHFEFSATVWPNGHYIHTIGGFHEQKVGYHFWLLYRLDAAPDTASPPVNTALSATGVDDVFPTNGEHILFWFKKI